MQGLKCCRALLPEFVTYCRLARWERRFYSSPSYYTVLGVPKNASRSEIKAAFVELSKKHHPDKNPESDASAQFCKISEAYSVLVDAKKRNLYDRGLYSQRSTSTGYQPGVSRDEKFDFYKYDPKTNSYAYARPHSYYDGYGTWKTVRTDTGSEEFQRKNLQFVKWLVVLMIVSAVVQSVRAVQGHKLYNERSLAKTRKYQEIYDELKEATVEEQLEKLAKGRD